MPALASKPVRRWPTARKLSPQQAKYFIMWNAACAARGWKASNTTIRHAVTFQALGFQRSSNAFTNRDWDHVYNLLEVLIDDLDLAAQIERAANENHAAAQAAHVPVIKTGKRHLKKRGVREHASDYERTTTADEPGQRRRLIYFISRLFTPALIRKICVDRFDKADWEELPIPDLMQLRDILGNRLDKWLTTAKERPYHYNLPEAEVAYNSRTGVPSNKAYITALLERGTPINLRLDDEEENVGPQNTIEASEVDEEGDPY